jgi:hypothetical protein
MGARIGRPGPSLTSLPSSECSSRPERPGSPSPLEDGPLAAGAPHSSPHHPQGPEQPGEQGGGHGEAAAPPAIGRRTIGDLTDGKAIRNTR